MSNCKPLSKGSTHEKHIHQSGYCAFSLTSLIDMSLASSDDIRVRVLGEVSGLLNSSASPDCSLP